MKSKIISVIIMCLVGFLLIMAASGTNKDASDLTAEKGDKVQTDKDDIITVWYSYTGYEKYIESAIESYKKEKNIEFSYELKFISNPGFFDYINKKTLEGKGPDLFILGSEYLEKAYLLGLLEENTYSCYNDENYGNAAISSSVYNNKKYAYPMGFDVAVLAINNVYVRDEIKTFEDIKTYADNFNDISEDGNKAGDDSETDISKVSGILSWDVNNLLFNYGFIGNNISFEKAGNKEININNAGTREAISRYLVLKDYFSLTGDDGYSEIMSDFIEKKLVFGIVGTDIAGKAGDLDYTVQKIPDLDDNIKCGSLSYTDLIGVNPRAKNIQLTEDLAKYISYDYAENMYDISGIISCRKDIEYENKIINKCVEIYDASMTMPGILETEDFCIVMEEALKAIWNGSDAEEILSELQTKYSERIR